MAGFGHGSFTESRGEDALDHARRAVPVVPELAAGSVSGPAMPEVGQRVAVTPADYGRVPVAGTLVAWDWEEVVIAREDPATGLLLNHFPMAGFEVSPG